MMPDARTWVIILFVAVAVNAFRAGWDEATLPECAQPQPAVERRKELPEICAPFYLDGTGRWAECMGVGPK